MIDYNPLKQAKRVVVKLGTGLLTLKAGVGQLDTARISALSKQVKSLRDNGIEVILVSSGAVGLGMGKLRLERRPSDLASLQACAAIGQTILMNTWQQCLDPHDLTVGQILLTREDLRARHRHNAVYKTIERLLAHGAVPIVNENDTVSASEIKFGDNDTLSALVASVSHADLLFILSNIPGLIDMKGTGEVVPFVEKITPAIEAMAQGTKQVTSVGGMVSKLSAAKIAHRAGCGVYIGSGQDEELFNKLLNDERVGTFFAPSTYPVKAHRRWIAIQDHSHGSIVIDAGAALAIKAYGKSLLAAGVLACEGDFEEGDVIQIGTEENMPIAQGLAAMDATELKSIIGLTPQAAAEKLPHLASSVVTHRDNMVLLG